MEFFPVGMRGGDELRMCAPIVGTSHCSHALFGLTRRRHIASTESPPNALLLVFPLFGLRPCRRITAVRTAAGTTQPTASQLAPGVISVHCTSCCRKPISQNFCMHDASQYALCMHYFCRQSSLPCRRQSAEINTSSRNSLRSACPSRCLYALFVHITASA